MGENWALAKKHKTRRRGQVKHTRVQIHLHWYSAQAFLGTAGAHRPIRDGLVWIPFSRANLSQRVGKNVAILNQ